MNFFYWFAHQFSAEAGLGYRDWYLMIEKPFFAPPPFLFGLAWGIIYPLITIAFVWAIYLYLKKRAPLKFTLLFLLNIVLNLSFSPIVLASYDNVLASITIVLVVGTLAWLQVWAWRYSRVIFWLLVPYLLWGIFATVLQLSITALN